MASKLVPLLQLFEGEFKAEEMMCLLREFVSKTNECSKWTLYSDYCLDDKQKANDVITFVLFPFHNEELYKEIDNTILRTQPQDIKHTQHISSDFLAYVSHLDFFSYSFIVKDRKLLFGMTHKERIDTVTLLFQEIKQSIEIWKTNASGVEPIEYYDAVLIKIDRLIKQIHPKKNIKEHMDIFLVTLLGAIVAAQILKQFPYLEIVGWFPDRDSINEACDKIAFPLFHILLFSHLGGVQFQFATPEPDNTIIPFYDNFNRVADVICGTFADYDLVKNTVTKDKFSKVLRDLIADNPFIKLYSVFIEEDKLHLRTILISSSLSEGDFPN